jgi:hypothetical protein
MGNTSEKRAKAVQKLREQGHVIGDTFHSAESPGRILLEVDGITRTPNEIYILAGEMPEPE